MSLRGAANLGGERQPFLNGRRAQSNTERSISMAIVTFTVPESDLGSVDLKITAKGIGTLYVSKGGIDWRPYRAQPRKMNWKEFAEMIHEAKG
jgi:hypothetical protein